MSTLDTLFEDAARYIPGGVNSPVRAFGSVGGTPVFIREARGAYLLGEDEIDAMDFLALVREKVKLVKLDESLLKRPVNEGFSGGEKKRNEIFQMAVLEPALAILDETDSGLDIDALNEARRPRTGTHG